MTKETQKLLQGLDVVQMKDNRYTFREIGEKYGFTKQWAFHLYHKYKGVDKSLDESK